MPSLRGVELPARAYLLVAIPMIAIGLLLLVGTAARAETTSVFDGQSAVSGIESGPLFTGVADPEPVGDPGHSAGWLAGLRNAYEVGKDKEAREAAALISPAGVAERERSRSEFRDLSSAEAIKVARDEFGKELEPRAPDAETLFAGAPVAEYRSESVAVLAPSGGEPARLIESQVPLRAPDEDLPGTPKRTVDLDIERSGSGFEASNAAPDVTLPSKTTDPIEAGAVNLDVGGDAAAARVDGDTLAYPNVETDTDLIVNLTNEGFETFHQLRSPAAAETQRLDLDLPSGGTLKTQSDGGVQVVRGGKPVLSVSPPQANDAQGRDVPVTLRADGRSLALEVDHRGRDYAYPILVDPEFSVIDNGGCTSGSRTAQCPTDWFHSDPNALKTLAGWSYYQNDSPSSTYWSWSQYCHRNTAAQNFNTCYGPSRGVNTSNWMTSADPGYGGGQTGLHLWAGGGSPKAYGTNKYSQWSYIPNGQTTRVYQADWGNKWLLPGADTGGIQLFNGIWSYGANAWAAGPNYFAGGMTDDWNRDKAGSSPGVQQLNLVLANLGAPVRPSSFIKAYMGSMVMQLTDPEAPTVSNTSLSGPTGWTRDGRWTISGQATDSGLGVRRFRASVPVAGSATPAANDRIIKTANTTQDCVGTKALFCPASAAIGGSSSVAPVSVSAQDANDNALDGNQPMPDGINTVTLEVSDALGSGPDENGIRHDTPKAVGTVKVDRTPPAVTVSGPLKDAADRWVADGIYDVPLAATDGASGVASVGIMIDGIAAAPGATNSSAADGAPQNHTFSIDTAPLKYGPHTVTVTATDRVGNVGKSEWTILADAHRTEFKFDPPLSTTETKTVANSGDGLLSMRNETSDDEAGGYSAGATPQPPRMMGTDSVDTFAQQYRSTHDGRDPTIESIVFASSVPQSAMGSLASRVTDRSDIDLTTSQRYDVREDQAEAEAAYADDLAQADADAERDGDNRPSEEDPQTRASNSQPATRQWAPLYGTTFTTELGGPTPQFISQTLTWNKQSDLDLFNRDGELNDVYEHDFKLINKDNLNGFGPGCRIAGDTNNFWAVRKESTWRVSGPNLKAARAYFDTGSLDKCERLDFTIGVFFPQRLKARKRYTFAVFAKAGENPRSTYQLASEKLRRSCGRLTPNCVDIKQNSTEPAQLLIGPSKGSAPSCRRWRKGKSSRPC